MGGPWQDRKTVRDAMAANVPLISVLMVLERMSNTDADLAKRMESWATDCVAEVLPFYTDDNVLTDCVGRFRKNKTIDIALLVDLQETFSNGPIHMDSSFTAAKMTIDAVLALVQRQFLFASEYAEIAAEWASDDESAGPAMRQWQYNKLLEIMNDG